MPTYLVDALRYLLPAISFIGLVVGSVAYVTNQPYRDDVDHALKAGTKVPERMLPRGYKAEELREVKEQLRNKPAGDRRTLLDVYVSPVLYWNDIVFAVGMAVFSASLWLWVLLQIEPAGLARWLVIVFAVSSVVYGIADVAEDVMLARLFDRDTVADREVGLASALTQTKMVSMAVSVAGGLAFLALSVLTPHKRYDRVNSRAPS